MIGVTLLSLISVGFAYYLWCSFGWTGDWRSQARSIAVWFAFYATATVIYVVIGFDLSWSPDLLECLAPRHRGRKPVAADMCRARP